MIINTSIIENVVFLKATLKDGKTVAIGVDVGDQLQIFKNKLAHAEEELVRKVDELEGYNA